MKASAALHLKFASEKQLKAVCKALVPETKKPTTVHSTAFLRKEGVFLILNVKARDTVALRAALNAYLRWINSISNALEVLEPTRRLGHHEALSVK